MPDEKPITEAAEVPAEVAAATREGAESAVDESEDLVEQISDATAGKVEAIVQKHVGPLSDRVLALEQKGEAAVQAPPAAVEKAVTEAEPPLVHPKRKHWTSRLPRGLL